MAGENTMKSTLIMSFRFYASVRSTGFSYSWIRIKIPYLLALKVEMLTGSGRDSREGQGHLFGRLLPQASIPKTSMLPREQ
jgi:hypothetical protein